MPNVFSKTAKQIIEARIDDFIEGPSATSSNAIHDLHVRTTLGRWWNFEKEVRERVKGGRALNNRPLHFAPRGFLSEFHTSREQLFCGDEGFIQGRFNDNVSHVMTSVYRSEGVNCRFGDAKACTNKDLGGVPDIVCMAEDGEARIVGDLKAPWAHDLELAMANPEKRRTWLGLLTPRYIWKIEN